MNVLPARWGSRLSPLLGKRIAFPKCITRKPDQRENIGGPSIPAISASNRLSRRPSVAGEQHGSETLEEITRSKQKKMIQGDFVDEEL